MNAAPTPPAAATSTPATGQRPRVALVATARPTFELGSARSRAAAAHELLADLGADVVGPADLVMTPDDVAAAADHLVGADLVVNLCATFSDASPALALYPGLDAPVLLWSLPEPGPVGDRLWANSLCGANLFGHALVRAGGSVRLLHGDVEDPATRRTLTDALAGTLPAPVVPPLSTAPRAEATEVTPALAGLRGRTIGVVGDAPAGFTPSEYDPDVLEALFGVRVERMEVDEVFSAVDALDPAEREHEREASLARRPSLADLDDEVVARSAAVTTVLRGFGAGSALSGMAVRCWPELPTSLGVCPCAAMSQLADEGTPTACERDVYGVMTMMLTEALGGGTTYLVDTVDLDAAANLVRLWHCGAAATSLAADPARATQSVHCNRRIGVAGDFPLRTGRVVMVRLTEDGDPASRSGLRLLLAAGESLPEPNRFQGNTAAVRLDTDAAALVTGLVTDGYPHHTVLAWNDVRPQLRAVADRLGIAVAEWPGAPAEAPARPAHEGVTA